MTLSRADVGHRVVVRVRLVANGPGGSDGGYRDLLGELLSLDGASRTLVVRTRDGDVTVAADEVAAAKRVPPAPPKRPPGRGAPADRIDDLELERIAALGWRGLETTRIGGWLLRAAGGWTGRANSVLPLGDPGLPLDEALGQVADWYTTRGLPPTLQLPLPAGAALRTELTARGWTPRWGALVLTAALSNLAGQTPAEPLTLATTPSPEWLAAYHYRGGALPENAVSVLRTAAAPVFASVLEDGATIAICRAVVDERWLGITAVEVDPAHRRRGLATRLLAGVVAHAVEHGAHSAYLQVEHSNEGAIRMYQAAGFTVHHEYRYFRPEAFD